DGEDQGRRARGPREGRRGGRPDRRGDRGPGARGRGGRRRPHRASRRGRCAGRRRLHPSGRRDGQPGVLHHPRHPRRGGHHGLRRGTARDVARLARRLARDRCPGRAELLCRRGAHDALRRRGRPVLRVGGNRRAAPPGQGRRPLRDRPAHRCLGDRGPGGGRVRTGPGRDLDRPGGCSGGRPGRHQGAQPPGARSGRPPGGAPGRPGGDTEHPARLPRPGLVHARGAARCPRDRHPPWADGRSRSPARSGL
ncbi:MAG: 4-hydroxy-tetrahydrodipicolinate reductase, partial [uncultured Nocardioidaceae bacterium]